MDIIYSQDTEESDNGTDLPNLLRTKLDEYHKQSDELHTAVRKIRDKIRGLAWK